MRREARRATFSILILKIPRSPSLDGKTRSEVMKAGNNGCSARLRRAETMRAGAFWMFTLPVAYENAAAMMWLLLGVEYPRLMLAHLGYPPYFQYIMAPWKLACAAALLAPRLPRVKEWAYAGAFFNYSSALVSHLFAGDPPDLSAAVLGAFTILSWALRPSDRRLEESAPAGKAAAASWVASAVMLGLMLILSAAVSNFMVAMSPALPK
jgi:hypothetical protein